MATKNTHSKLENLQCASPLLQEFGSIFVNVFTAQWILIEMKRERNLKNERPRRHRSCNKHYIHYLNLTRHPARILVQYYCHHLFSLYTTLVFTRAPMVFLYYRERNLQRAYTYYFITYFFFIAVQHEFLCTRWCCLPPGIHRTRHHHHGI